MEMNSRADVLIVDDDDLVRGLQETVARSMGLTVATAASGEEAKLLLADPNSWPKLILSDLEMPGGSGSDLVAWLRASKADLPRVVLVSGAPGLAGTAAALGVEHVCKPVTPAVLRDLLRSADAVAHEQDLVSRVRVALTREFTGMGLVNLALRLDDSSPARSVFGVARLNDGSVAMARVYEADLDDGRSLPVAYLAAEDVALVQQFLFETRT